MNFRNPAWRTLVFPLLPPLAACLVQTLLWHWLSPLLWILFYPAVFFSSWIGGKWGGLLGTILSAFLAAAFFMPPGSFGSIGLKTCLSIGMFAGMGLLFGLFNERLIKTNRELREALVREQSAVDLLERKVLERTQELEQSLDYLHKSNYTRNAALASMADAVFISDLDGVFVEFNDAFATFHRFGCREQCAKKLADYPDIIQVFFPSGEEAPLDMWAVPRALRGETVTNAEYTIRRRDTGETWIGSYNFGPIRDDTGAIIGSVVVGRDVTGQKLEEQEIKMLNAKLEMSIDDRTRELERANKELSSFTYTVSHDLRAPLRHINGFAEILKNASQGQLSAKCVGYLNTIQCASNEMGQLIDDLLAYSRTGRVEMHERRLDLGCLVREAVCAIEAENPMRAIVWKISELPNVVGDASLLRQVLLNFLRNAVKYSSKRERSEIELGVGGEEEGRIVIYVRDNGVGFDMRFAGKLFGVFQRLHCSDEFEGTGIGLAIVHSIIARHGGRTWAESKPDQGATFYFTLKPTNEGMQR